MASEKFLSVNASNLFTCNRSYGDIMDGIVVLKNVKGSITERSFSFKKNIVEQPLRISLGIYDEYHKKSYLF